jgi:hypothetical protein
VLKVLGSTLRTKGDPYVDASRITDPGASVSVRGGRTEYFTHKLHTMLDELEREGLAEICCWLPHGRYATSEGKSFAPPRTSNSEPHH